MTISYGRATSGGAGDSTGGRSPDAGAPGSTAGRVVLRPRLVRTVGFTLGTIVLVGTTIMALLVPNFSVVNRGSFIALGLAVFWFCYREASVRIIADPDELIVRNLFTTTRLEWPAVVGVSFPQGDPWAHLDLADGDTLGAMALQRSDGEKGIAAARVLASLVRERGEAPDLPL